MNPAAQQPVFIVDDDPSVLDSLSILLQTSGIRTICYGSAQAFLDACAPGTTGCLLLDVQMPGMNGLELQQRLNRAKIRIPTIIITGHGNIATAVKAMKSGAFDFLEKPYREAEIIGKIRNALASLEPLDVEAEALAGFPGRYAGLTDREQEVFREMVKGQANKTIARALGISYRTVEIHRSRVLQKMGVKNLSELIRLAIRSHMA